MTAPKGRERQPGDVVRLSCAGVEHDGRLVRRSELDCWLVQVPDIPSCRDFGGQDGLLRHEDELKEIV
jgi:hypothetical protein